MYKISNKEQKKVVRDARVKSIKKWRSLILKRLEDNIKLLE